MNKAFEKILERLEELKNHYHKCCLVDYNEGAEVALTEAMLIVREVAGEYNGGWIACSERLPEKNGMYICTQNRYDLATNKNIISVSTELVEFDNGKWRRAKNLVVTHWQPLPEPYQDN